MERDIVGVADSEQASVDASGSSASRDRNVRMVQVEYH